jgi:hypothetical protein
MTSPRTTSPARPGGPKGPHPGRGEAGETRPRPGRGRANWASWRTKKFFTRSSASRFLSIPIGRNGRRKGEGTSSVASVTSGAASSDRAAASVKCQIRHIRSVSTGSGKGVIGMASRPPAASLRPPIPRGAWVADPVPRWIPEQKPAGVSDGCPFSESDS